MTAPIHDPTTIDGRLENILAPLDPEQRMRALIFALVRQRPSVKRAILHALERHLSKLATDAARLQRVQP